MITPSFTKLQRSILTSSIWLQDAPTRLVWITLLALCDRDGISRCSLAGLAHQARVEPGECVRAVDTLMAPDPDSRDLGDGRRIERVPGGYLLLSYQRVLGEGAREERREYMRAAQERSRAKRRADGGTVRTEHRDDAPPRPRHRKKKPRSDAVTGIIAPASEEHGGSYEQYRNGHRGNGL